MRKSVVIVILLVVTHILSFIIGYSIKPKPVVVIEEINTAVINNKIGERDAIISIYKLPPDSVAILLNNYYKK